MLGFLKRGFTMCALVAISWLCSVQAFADFMSGARLLTYCRSSNTDAKGICMGYVTGVADAIARRSCFPERLDPGTVVSTVIQWIEQNPRDTDKSGESLVTNALTNAYPCAKRYK